MYSCPSCNKEMIFINKLLYQSIYHCSLCKITYCESPIENIGSLFINDLSPDKYTVEPLFKGSYKECCKVFKLKAFI